ncbi:MAG TPA: hypothetical protein VKA97_09075, partial [Pyrinomonadaceae bacterium]|nr:hypothetical protein [Pyrinomonadaceae bacterium]
FRPERPKYAPVFALSGLDLNFDSSPGATRSALLHACPWLLYLAPLALCCDVQGKACRGRSSTLTWKRWMA